MAKLLAFVLLTLAAPLAFAEATGPDYWAVTGINPSSTLNLRLGPSTGFRAVGTIPASAVKLENRGCTPDLSFGEWQALNNREQRLLRIISWCRVAYKNQQGWVAARYLRESNVH